LYCSHCGHQLQDNDKFCIKCGAKAGVPAAEAGAEVSERSTLAQGSTAASSSSSLADAWLDFTIDTQPMLLPLEKIELLIDDVPYPRIFKFGASEKIKIAPGNHRLQAVINVTILKRRSDLVAFTIQPGAVRKVLLDYNNVTGGCKLIV
jgi:hypothetical protein